MAKDLDSVPQRVVSKKGKKQSTPERGQTVDTGKGTDRETGETWAQQQAGL